MDSGAAHKNILSTSEVYNQAPYLRIHYYVGLLDLVRRHEEGQMLRSGGISALMPHLSL